MWRNSHRRNPPRPFPVGAVLCLQFFRKTPRRVRKLARGHIVKLRRRQSYLAKGVRFNRVPCRYFKIGVAVDALARYFFSSCSGLN